MAKSPLPPWDKRHPDATHIGSDNSPYYYGGGGSRPGSEPPYYHGAGGYRVPKPRPRTKPKVPPPKPGSRNI